MKTFKDEVTDWIQSNPQEDGHMEMAAYADSIVMVRLEGDAFLLPDDWPITQWHVFLQLFSGELYLTSNDNRFGFESPVIIDFIEDYDWKRVKLMNHFQACILITKHEFFLDSVISLRHKVTEMMLHFAQNPFVPLKKENADCLRQLSNALFASMSADNKLLKQEQIQMLLCAGQCEMWNAIFSQHNHPLTKDDPQWNSIVAHFLHLAHLHFREQHEVRWYATQLGCSPDVLSTKLKRMYGKNASMLLNERLIMEAKILLQKPEYTVQHVAEMLSFSDQSAFGKFFKRHYHMSPRQYRLQTEKAGERQGISQKTAE